MIRPATLLALLADAIVCVVIGVGLPLLVGTIGGLAASNWATFPWEDAATAATALWALGLGGGVGITVAPEAVPALQLAEPFAFVVSIAPLAFTALIAWFGWRAGARLLDSDSPWVGLGVSTLAFGAAAAASLQFARGGVVRIDTWGAVVTGTLVWLAAALIGLRVWEHLPWQRWLGARTDAILGRTGDALRLAGGYVVGMIGLASAALLVSAITGFGRVIGLMQSLHVDTWGAVTLGLVHLAYLPTLIVWAIAWLLGPGVALGAGSLANPGGTATAPLPAVPMFGLIPDGLSPLWWAIVALPVLVAAIIVLIERMRSSRDDVDGARRLITPLLAALMAAALLALLAHLSRGALGPGRLTEFGPSPLWTLAAAFGAFALGGAVGAVLPLSTFERAGVGDRRGDAGGRDRAASTGTPERRSSTAETIDLADVRERVRGEGDATAWWAKDAETPTRPSGERSRGSREEPGEVDAATVPAPGADKPGPGTELDVAASHPVAKPDAQDSGDASPRPRAAGKKRRLDDVAAKDRADATATPAVRPDDDAHEDAGEENDEDAPATTPDAQARDRRSKRQSTRPELTDVLRRPDEPDIYADLDDL